jgi:hypothetical protein
VGVAGAHPRSREGHDGDPAEGAERTVREGRQIFRFDTFGDEAFWGGQLRLHEAVATLSPAAALGLGLKVDVDALSGGQREAIRHGRINVNDPRVTAQLLRQDAVLGVAGFFDRDGGLKSIGITCALCHSTVDDSLAPGIGHRLDGVANRDLNVGAIIAAAPNVDPFVGLLQLADPSIDAAKVRAVLLSWGPGKFDA